MGDDKTTSFFDVEKIRIPFSSREEFEKQYMCKFDRVDYTYHEKARSSSRSIVEENARRSLEELHYKEYTKLLGLPKDLTGFDLTNEADDYMDMLKYAAMGTKYSGDLKVPTGSEAEPDWSEFWE